VERDRVEELDSVGALNNVVAKTMVSSPLWAAAISARSDPEPLSPVLVTVSVLNSQRSSSVSSSGRKPARWRRDIRVRLRATGAERLQFRGKDENNMMFLLSRIGRR